MPLRHVFLDPDGSQGDYLYAIVEAATGVVYENQCGGPATFQRGCEGYLVPLWGAKTNTEEGRVEPAELAAAFHEGERCMYGDSALPPDRLDALEAAVRTIPFWTSDGRGGDLRALLALDRARLDELVEAWVPVTTPVGRAILVWKNCD